MVDGSIRYQRVGMQDGGAADTIDATSSAAPNRGLNAATSGSPLWQQLTIVLKKCFMSKRRAPIAALFELLAPCLIALVLVAVRPSVIDENE